MDRVITDIEIGYYEGEKCNRDSCDGVIEEHEKEEGCSCHINPPCSSCTTNYEHCPECDWSAEDEKYEKVKSLLEKTEEKPFLQWWKTRTLKDLDNTKIDYISKSHTHFSMIKEGVYPEGTEMADVLKVVRGTFGGRFEYFGDGKFKYIAYTD